MQVRLLTKSQEFAVSDAVMNVPETLDPSGLSELINHLLERDVPVSFEFLINKTFLRTSLKQFMDARNLSLENIVEIEYVEASRPPSAIAEFEQDDWVSSITATADFVACGLYNATVNILNLSGEELCTLELESPVKSLSWLNNSSISIGCQNGELFMAKFDAETNTISTFAECLGHQASINSLSFSPSLNFFASASQDKSIQLWSTNVSANASDTRSSKKRKGERQITKVSCVTSLENHSDAVSCVSFSKSNENQLFSGGWDHSIRAWDISQATNTHTMNCDHVLTCLDNNESSVLLTGHTDSMIRLWDMRSTDKESKSAMNCKFMGHSGWISSIKWLSETVFASSSYDGTVKIWDTRSIKPLHSLQASQEDEKILDMDWVNGFVFAGGENKKVSVIECKLA